MQTKQRNWHCLRLVLAATACEEFAAYCFVLGSCGSEQEDSGKQVRLKVYFELGADIAAIDRQISTQWKKLEVEEAVWEICPEQDWEQEWRRFFKPIWATERIVVHPSWEPVQLTGNQIAIIIDPKMAFGTGGHETTRLCLQHLEQLVTPGQQLLDLGCGSGVLSIAAAKLGAGKIWAVDIDPLAVENSNENLARNGVEGAAQVLLGSIDAVVGERFDTILANIQSHILRPMLERIKECLKPGGTVLFSGLLATEGDTFCQWLAEWGLQVEQVDQMGEWIAIKANEGGDA